MSLAPELRGGQWGATRDLYFSTSNKFAELQMPWKLVLLPAKTELFRLDNDPGEIKNLAPSQGSRVAAMRQRINSWRQKVGR